MRTTVKLDDDLLQRAKREATLRRTTITALIEQGLRLVLAQLSSRQRRKRVVLPVCRMGGGTLPGVNLNDRFALQDTMEGRQ
jgi:hypothetical protein